jgi:hypothetical protein
LQIAKHETIPCLERALRALARVDEELRERAPDQLVGRQACHSPERRIRAGHAITGQPDYAVIQGVQEWLPFVRGE